MVDRLLGIDPGLNNTGWGMINVSGNHLKYIACGTIKTDSKQPLADRLLTISKGLSIVIDRYSPTDSAIEETFVNKNAGSSLKLGHARGAIMLTVSLAGLPIKEYSATKVKKSVVGVGRADKEQVSMMVKVIMPDAIIDGYDAADALAVAICHSHHANSYKVA